jgi:hypothetical protein
MGKTIQLLDAGGGANPTITCGIDGTFGESNTGGQPAYGTYGYNTYSPVGALLTFYYSDPNNLWSVCYLQLTFSSASAGNYYMEFYPTVPGSPSFLGTGTFTLP